MTSLPSIDFDALAPYALPENEKKLFLLTHLDALTRFHAQACRPYANAINTVFGGVHERPYSHLEDIPFVPVSLFKDLDDMVSVPRGHVFKVLTSSGTTGQQVSRIYLDRTTADLQAKALVKTMQHFLGKERLPMVILDHPGVLRDRTSFSARGAGILGMMQFGRQPFYACRDDMSLDVDGLEDYLRRNNRSRVLFFGFTFMIWQHVAMELLARGRRLAHHGGILIHSGGWKKLEAQRVSNGDFVRGCKDTLSVDKVLNFYGMVEQVGSVYFENQLGFLQASAFSDVIIRDPFTLRPLPNGETGLIQVLSILPRSYPGHSLLTADMGRIVGCDHPEAGGHGRYFEVLGRAPRSEVRGCSDTYEQRHAL